MESSGLHELFTSSSTPDTTIMDSRKFGLAFIKIVDIKSGLNGFNIVAKVSCYRNVDRRLLRIQEAGKHHA